MYASTRDYTLVSSAHNSSLESTLIPNVKSSMCSKNNNRPHVEPWVTPLFIVSQFEKVLPS
jgi:hypothetical protein